MTKTIIALAFALAVLGGCATAPAAAPVATAAVPTGATPPPPPPPPPAWAEEEARARAEQEQRQRAAEHDAAAAAMRRAAEERASARAPTRTASTAAGARRPRAAATQPQAPVQAPPQSQVIEAANDPLRVDDVLARLRRGNIAFNTPSTINIADTVTIEMLVSPVQPQAELAARVAEPGEVVSAALEVSDQMEARLTGKGFAIVPLTSARQWVDARGGRWAWDVTPTKEGAHELKLSVDALVTLDGQTAPVTLRTFERSIQVDVTVRQRIGNWVGQHGKWAWGALLLPAWGWWNKRRKDKEKARAAARPAA